MDKNLMEKIFAYNRAIIAQEKKARKVETIKDILQSIGEQPDLPELLSFFREIQEVVQDH